jgi:hypothetical protein
VLETATLRQSVSILGRTPTDDDVDDGTLRFAGTTGTLAWVGVAGGCSNATADRARRMNVQFDLSDIPACATVTSAALTFHHTGCITCNQAGSISLVKIGTSWTESATAGACAGVAAGASAVGGFTASAAAAVAVPPLAPTDAPGTFSFDVTSDVQSLATSGVNHGWQLRYSGGAVLPQPDCVVDPVGAAGNWACNPTNGGTGCGGNKRMIFTKEAVDPLNWPSLDVTYSLTDANCNDSNPCTSNQCAALGCVFQNDDSLSCTDGIACTSDSCVGGACISTPDNGLCADTNVCTNDTCTPGVGCTYVNNTLPCSDGVACTLSDTCGGGVCVGTPNNGLCPDDANPCTTNTCTAAGCSYPPNTLPCNDGVFCTLPDTCNGAGSCVGTPSAARCSDGNGCTDDTCSPGNPSANANGCIYQNNVLTCDDAVACTLGDTCGGGSCAGTPTNGQCNDSNDCTTDLCTGGVGCSHAPLANGAPCTWDANVCHKSTCQGSVCNSPNPGVSCRAGSCADGSPAMAIAPAACTAGGVCPAVQTASCGGQPCNATHTACQGACALDTDCPSGFFCAAGGACAAKLPAGGACARLAMCGAGLFCTDGVCCTAACGNSNPTDCQACNAAGACVNQTGTACQDGSACTTSDTCNAGACVGGAAPNCNDLNPCTADACSPATGCTHVPGGAGLSCRAAAGACDVAETCNGVNPTCPVDAFQPNTFPCRSAACATGTQTLGANCPGNATACPGAVTGACTPYVCGPTACKTTCAGDLDCIAGDYCDAANKCSPKGQAGAACTAINQCASGQCADGVCCDTACTGQCEACNVQGSVGICKAVSGTPALPRAACASDGSACKGACNGIVTTDCTYPGGVTRCRSPSCIGNVQTLQTLCAGTGSCAAAQTSACSPFVCGPTQCETSCTSDTQCQSGLYCDTGTCVPLVTAGGKCLRDSQCGTGICVDTVCCNARCTGQCEACDVTGSEGTCSPVPSGPPHKGRPLCVTDDTVCGGQCNGTSRDACVYAGPGKVCHPPTCAAGKAGIAEYCEGTGKCPAQETIDCKGPCVRSLCGDECATDQQCSLLQFCLAGQCVPQRDNGQPCTSQGQCSSSYCVDGVCCSAACSGQCQACDVTGSEGTCAAVVGPPRGVRAPCVSNDKTCEGSCDGSKSDGCTYPGVSTVCTPAKCATGVATLAQTCAGDGSCGPLQEQVCAPYVCGGAKCAGNCTADTDCPGGNYCSADVCVTKLLPGTPCAGASQCGTNFCVDGVCCDKTCGRQCEACNAPSSVGRCVTVVGRPHGVRPTCGGTAACEGLCNGTDPNVCRFPATLTACGDDFCATGVTRLAPTCNGAGTCIASDTQDCFPGACNQAGTGCAATCTTQDDCGPGLVCTAHGTCEVPPPPPDAGLADGGLGGTDAGAGAGGAGNAGAGGKPAGTGGSARGAGGSTSPDAGQTPPNAGVDGGSQASSGDKGSCGCRLGRTAPRNGWLVGIAALAWLTARRRTRSYASRHLRV